MRTTTLLIALLSSSASLQHTLQQQALVKGCTAWNPYTGTCDSCYRRQVTSTGCGPLLPVTDTCKVHREQQGQKLYCSACKLGYGQSLPQGDICVPLGIFNCLIGFIDTDNTKYCSICGNGQYPTANGTKCAPLATGAIPNCDAGMISKGVASCYRCNSGYAVAYNSKSCVAVTAATAGCAFLNPDGASCNSCNVQAGYSMQKSGVCKFINNA